jgi:hypothetical protein
VGYEGEEGGRGSGNRVQSCGTTLIRVLNTHISYAVRLGAPVIEAIKCQRHWMRVGLGITIRALSDYLIDQGRSTLGSPRATKRGSGPLIGQKGESYQSVYAFN